MTRTAVLSDESWARIEPLLPPLKAPMGRPMTGHRKLVKGSIYRLRTGIAWRDLPVEFGPWQTFGNGTWVCKDGTWDKLLLALQAQAAARSEIDWDVSVDSTIRHRSGVAGSSVGRRVPFGLVEGVIALLCLMCINIIPQALRIGTS
jgi:transposase